MNVFQKVTLESLKKNKTRTIVTIIGIILSAAMICAVTSFTSSFRNYAYEDAVYTCGRWHGRAVDTTFEMYEALSGEKEVERAVYLQQLGYAKLPGGKNEFKPYLYLLGAGEGAEEALSIHVSSGHYPVSEQEILLPEHVYSNGGVKYEIGDTLTLELGTRMVDGYSLNQFNPCYIYNEDGEEVLVEETLEVKETRTYTVVGFYERLSYNLEGYSAPGYTAITLADRQASDEYMYNIFYEMKHPNNIYDFMKKQGLDIDENTDVLMYLGVSQYSSFSTVLYSLAAIVIGLIMFGSISLIYNAFSISVSERTRQFGLLASIGATRKQLRKMVLFEAMVVSIIGIPIGIFAGIGGIGVTLTLLRDRFRAMNSDVDLELSVSLGAVGIAILVALVTVLLSAWIPSKRATRISAVEAIRQNTDVKITENKKIDRKLRGLGLTYKIFGLPGMIASKHYKRNKRKYRTTVASLFMSIVLFVSATAFADYLTESVSGGFGGVKYDVGFDVNEEEFHDISPEELLEKVEQEQTVTDAVYCQSPYLAGEVKQEYLTKEALSGEYDDVFENDNGDTSTKMLHFCVQFIDDNSFKQLLKEQGLKEQDYMNPEQPLAIAVEGGMVFNMERGKYEKIEYFNANQVEIVRRTEQEEGEYETTILKVGMVIDEPPFFVSHRPGLNLIYPISLANLVEKDYVNNNYHYLITSSQHGETYTAVKELLMEYGMDDKTVYDWAAEVESERNFILIIRVFSYGFIVLISLIAAANVFNTIYTNISLRRREFAMLKSVGMTAKGINKMMNYECLLYGSRSLLFGLPVSVGITYLIYLSITQGYDASFQLPWTAMGIAVLSVFLVVFSTMIYSMSKIKKENLIDSLKNENM